MKTNKKILFTATAFVIVLLFSTLLILRDSVQPLLQKAKVQNQYQVVYQEKFKGLDFSANWTVTILQGKKYKVEIASEDNEAPKTKLQNIDDTLYFKTDTTHSQKNQGIRRAKITVPTLSYIRSAGGTKIQLIEFQSDSLSIYIDKGGEFTGYNSKFKYLSLKTTGHTQAKFNNTD